MKIETSHSTVNVHLSYDEGDEKALTQTEVVLKEIIAALQKEDCRNIQSENGYVSLDEFDQALTTIQAILYDISSDTEAW